MTDISRRKFIGLTVIGGAVAASGCDLKKHSVYTPRIYRAEASGQYGGYDDVALPYVNQPDGVQDGVPQYYATVCQMCPAGCGLYVRTMGGRAHQVQGNPSHPVSGGKVCSRGVSSLQHLYHVDRLRFPIVKASRQAPGSTASWDDALARTVNALVGARGRVAILADAVTVERQPSLARLLRQFAKSAGAEIISYALLDYAPWRAAARAVYGKSQLPAYRLDEADYILAFGSDFLDGGPSQVLYNRWFGEFRQGPRRAQGTHGKFVYIGPRMNATCAKADVWLPCSPGAEGLVAQALLRALSGTGSDIAATEGASGLSAGQLDAVVRDWRGAGARAVAIGGGSILGQPNATRTMTAIEALNVQAGSVCVSFGTAALPVAGSQAYGRQAQGLIKAMQGGRIGALLVLGQANPSFTLPPSLGWDAALRRVPFVAALTPFEDETSAHADVLLPTRSPLEDWGDDIPDVLPAGVTMATLRQPVIDPMYITDAPGLSPQDFAHDLVPWMETRGLGDVLIDLARRLGKPLPDADMRGAVRRTWAGLGQADLKADGTNNDPAWLAALAKGGVWIQAAPVPAVGRALPNLPATAPEAAPEGTYALHLFPQSYWSDGRHANLPWLQEHPDPMSMAVWNSWVEINMDVAHRLGIRTGDLVRVSGPQGSVEAPAIPFPGLHPGVVAMPIGQGHGAYGRHATGRGVNPLVLLSGAQEAQTGALALGGTFVRVEKVRDARPGYNGRETLVLPQDRPSGTEPDAVKDLIHTTSKEWKQAGPVTGAPQAEGSIFNRQGTVKNPGERAPGE